MRINPNLLKDAQVMLHPLRFRIIRALDDKPMNIAQLTRKLKGKRPMIAFHLGTLKEQGFVYMVEYKILKKPTGDKKGRATTTYSPTNKVDSRMTELRQLLGELGY